MSLKHHNKSKNVGDMNYDILGVKLPIRLLKIYTELFLQNRFDKRNNSFLKSESLFFSNFD